MARRLQGQEPLLSGDKLHGDTLLPCHHQHWSVNEDDTGSSGSCLTSGTGGGCAEGIARRVTDFLDKMCKILYIGQYNTRTEGPVCRPAAATERHVSMRVRI
jgi:hypothetical protein